MSDLSEFLNWMADRLVHVYGENPNVDFVLACRRHADSLPPTFRPSPYPYICKHGCERDVLKDRIHALENGLPCVVAEKESDLVVMIRELVTVLDLLRVGKDAKFHRVQSRCGSMVEVDSVIRKAEAVLAMPRDAG